MRRLSTRIVLVSVCLGLMAVAGPIFGSSQQVGRAAQAPTAMGIDVDPTGNDATSLGAIDDCLSVASGSTFDIDIFVANVNDLSGWQATFIYDPSVVILIDEKVDLFLATDPDSNITNLSDYPPDSDGEFLFAAADLRQREGGEDGSGILARLTLQAVGAGATGLELWEPLLAEWSGNIIGDVDGNDFFDGPVLNAQVAVDQDCVSEPLPMRTATPEVTASPPAAETPATPAAPSPTPSPTPAATAPATPVEPSSLTPAAGEPAEDGDGFPWAIAVGAGAGGVVLLALALIGWRLLQRRA